MKCIDVVFVDITLEIIVFEIFFIPVTEGEQCQISTEYLKNCLHETNLFLNSMNTSVKIGSYQAGRPSTISKGSLTVLEVWTSPSSLPLFDLSMLLSSMSGCPSG